MKKVGVIGLGIMGSAYSKNFISAGVSVMGCDPVAPARERLTAVGGVSYSNLGDWLQECDLIVLSLSSPSVLHSVCEDLRRFLPSGSVVLETGTFSLADKLEAFECLSLDGITLLDCPVSGTGAQAAERDILMMASGDDKAIEHALPYISLFTKSVIRAGTFGMGTKLKFVANHAVALHNVAAAEVLNYSNALGLDPEVTYNMLSNGAGNSKMLELRMPLMISGKYEPPTATLKMFEKDLSIIGDDLARLEVSAPMFEVVKSMYEAASNTLPETHDTASVFEVYKSSNTKVQK